MTGDRRTAFSLLVALLAAPTFAHAGEAKPRIIVLTDIAVNTVEPDDMESMIRLLSHADLFEIEGLVATTGWSDGGGGEKPELIRTAIDAYEKDLPNLLKRTGPDAKPTEAAKQQLGEWPSAKYLSDRVVVGSTKRGWKFVGENNDSPGSELIIRAADEADDRPIYVGVWGGGNTVAQAIWRVQHDRTPEQLKAFLHKLRVYTITDQDRGYGNTPYTDSAHYWLRKTFDGDLKFIWDESAWLFQNAQGKSHWNEYAEKIQNHGALGTLYPKFKWGVEGDTPSYLYVWPNGLNDPEQPTFGGWGGLFKHEITLDKETLAFTNHKNSSVAAASRKYEKQFYPAIFNDFAARMDWAKDGKGNRNPIAVVDGDETLAAIHLTPAEGATVRLDASKSRDPDGDALTYSWWQMPEAGTFDGAVEITGADAAIATVAVPKTSAGKSIHVVCEITDHGTPALTAYRRVIIEPK